MRLTVTEREMEREHHVQLARWKAAKETRNKAPADGAKRSAAKKSGKSKLPSDHSSWPANQLIVVCFSVGVFFSDLVEWLPLFSETWMRREFTHGQAK